MPGLGPADLGPTYEKFLRGPPCFLTLQDRDFRILSTNENFKATLGKGPGAPAIRPIIEEGPNAPTAWWSERLEITAARMPPAALEDRSWWNGRSGMG